MEINTVYESTEDHIYSVSEDQNDERELLRESIECWFPDSSL